MRKGTHKKSGARGSNPNAATTPRYSICLGKLELEHFSFTDLNDDAQK